MKTPMLWEDFGKYTGYFLFAFGALWGMWLLGAGLDGTGASQISKVIAISGVTLVIASDFRKAIG